jgi:hypothetical protein
MAPEDKWEKQEKKRKEQTNLLDWRKKKKNENSPKERK